MTCDSDRLPRPPHPIDPDGGAGGSRCLVVTGPTAAGKTRLVLALSDALDVVAVSADSRQVYCGFDIGTAKPTAADRAVVPHTCLDLTAPTVRFSAYAWAAEAERALDEAWVAGRAPLVVGGAGFYVRALVHPVTPEAPQGAERISAYYLLVDPGAPLRDRVAQRAATMMNGGWPEEVESLLRDVPSDAVAWNACGYGAIRAYVEGRLSREAALERVVVATRQYAKRQRTWFRHQLPVGRVTRVNPDDPDAVRHAVTWVRRHSASPAGAR